jgi:orotidine-5'-phosphate decarboxylase
MNRQELVKEIFEKKSFLCVGLDTDINKIPDFLKDNKDAIFEFNKAIIDATAPYCVALQAQPRFLRVLWARRYERVVKTINYLRGAYPKHFIIADAKRGDIGNTSTMYAKSFFGNLGVDALTVAPYMGEDSLTPFLEYKDKWTIVLALTSNKGSHDFQLTEDKNGERLFEKVIKKTQQWGTEDNMMYVVGATQGQMFEDIRKVAPNHFLLVPGVGAQGGSLQEVCKYGMIKDCGLLINSSRGIIYAGHDEHFAEAARDKAKDLQQQMQKELEAL